MRLSLQVGISVAVSPVFPWERNRTDLVIYADRGFHPRHATSRLCLELLWRYRETLVGRRILDVGCGSGALALMAARLGAAYAVGVDIHGAAVRLARKNARINGLSDRTDWVRGSLDAVKGRFFHVAANLPWDVLVQMWDDLFRYLEPEGRIFLSGFHETHLPQVQFMIRGKKRRIEKVLMADQAFYGIPPSGSYTWVALTAGPVDPEGRSPTV